MAFYAPPGKALTGVLLELTGASLPDVQPWRGESSGPKCIQPRKPTPRLCPRVRGRDARSCWCPRIRTRPLEINITSPQVGRRQRRGQPRRAGRKVPYTYLEDPLAEVIAVTKWKNDYPAGGGGGGKGLVEIRAIPFLSSGINCRCDFPIRNSEFT